MNTTMGSVQSLGGSSVALSSGHPVCWGAVFAGAAAAAAISLLMLMLGTGLGLSSVSPWSSDGMSAASFGVSTILWITFTQLVASGLGGYMAGRLRSGWDGVHSDEVYFRDTAHGFLAWAVASLATAALLTSVIGSIVGGGVKAASNLAGGAVAGATLAASSEAKDGDGDAIGYSVDSLLRRQLGDAPPPNPDTAPDREVAAETTRILAQAIKAGALSPEDTRYLGQRVAQRSGLSQAEAERKVTDTVAQLQASARDAQTAAREAADSARKASAYGSLWMFVALLVGAFIACVTALLGGRHRID